VQSIIFPNSGDNGHPKTGSINYSNMTNSSAEILTKIPHRGWGLENKQTNLGSVYRVVTNERIQATTKITEIAINTYCCQVRRGFSSRITFLLFDERFDIFCYSSIHYFTTLSSIFRISSTALQREKLEDVLQVIFPCQKCKDIDILIYAILLI